MLETIENKKSSVGTKIVKLIPNLRVADEKSTPVLRIVKSSKQQENALKNKGVFYLPVTKTTIRG